ncbi:MAG: chromate transporter [Erysipelotrichaceae bacterium]|nr:chromate transporter [Erysipelotrichaceae bacterium]MBR3167995.1 chromate transporter [Erysipelotrichaceae bacterium]
MSEKTRSAFYDQPHPYISLFIKMLTISAFTFGGGFVIISMMRRTFAQKLKWLDDQEVLDMTAIAQSAPGALGVNSAIIFGYRIAGIPGVAISLTATVIPPLVILSVLAFFYKQFIGNPVAQTVMQVLRAGVAAVIVDVVIDLASNVIKSKDVLNLVLMIAAFLALAVFKISSLAIILIALLIGIFPMGGKKE